ncbi:signal peptide peptidase SppA [Lysobacteraceae bacterium NML07-0707]|nr:signal peptide peptidase SppA [Xanthomonadaceae bacterium NML07-0707]
MNSIYPPQIPPPLPAQRGPIVRFFIGLWDAMNFTRRLILNLLFFGLLFFFVLVMLIGMAAGGKSATPKLSSNTTLVLAPVGQLVEQDSRDAMTRILADISNDDSQGQIQLRDMLAVIDGAAKDKHIERMLLDVDGLSPGGFASMSEVAAALQRFRAAGKQIVAVSRGMGQKQYFLAAQADEIHLDPDGYGIVLEGLSAHRPYFREGLQDKLGVDFHLFKVGEYKSAAEPFVRDSASPEAKEADLFWMNDIWNRYLAEIAARRKLSATGLATAIDNLADGVEAVHGDLNRYALENKLVDALNTREEVDMLMTERGMADADAEGGFRQIDWAHYLNHIKPKFPVEVDSRPQVAVVVAEGEITPGQQPRAVIGGDSLSALLRDVREDDKVKALVLRVNSPGGEVFASEQIRREVAAFKAAGKPVVVSMGDVAASGGYWISMNADRIYAEPSTITGSIGIFGLVPNFTRALDKIGVHSDGVGTTRVAGAFDPTRPLNPEVSRVIQSVIDKGYRDFIGKVADARSKSVEATDQVARGRVWSGAQAQQFGLVDELGGLQTAIEHAAKLGNLAEGKYHVHYVEEPLTPFESFMSEFAQAHMGAVLLNESPLLRGILKNSAPGIQQPLRYLEMQASKPNAAPVQASAHCFCGI